MARRWLAAVVCAVLVSGCGLEQTVGGDGASGGPPQGSTAPPLTGTLVNGAGFDLGALRGRPVVVDFFASWCGPCQAQQADISAVARLYAGRVDFVGVDDREGVAAARGFLVTNKVPYSALVDADGHIYGDYNIPAPPTTVIVDGAGLVAAGYLGGVTRAKLEVLLDRLLGAEAAAGSSTGGRSASSAAAGT